MAQQILQLNFAFNVSRTEYEQLVSPLADQFARVPGCQWKIWLMDENNAEAGGIYLFENEASVEQFKASELATTVLSSPALSDISVKQFEVLTELSRATHAPLAAKGVTA